MRPTMIIDFRYSWDVTMFLLRIHFHFRFLEHQNLVEPEKTVMIRHGLKNTSNFKN